MAPDPLSHFMPEILDVDLRNFNFIIGGAELRDQPSDHT
jgi:hypothetical protein